MRRDLPGCDGGDALFHQSPVVDEETPLSPRPERLSSGFGEAGIGPPEPGVQARAA